MKLRDLERHLTAHGAAQGRRRRQAHQVAQRRRQPRDLPPAWNPRALVRSVAQRAADYRDHDPPHFHAVYREYQAQVVIATLEPLSRELPARALGLVRESADLHRSKLEANWTKARAREPLDTIPPLP